MSDGLIDAAEGWYDERRNMPGHYSHQAEAYPGQHDRTAASLKEHNVKRNADMAVEARREGRAWTRALYSTARSVAYGLDGLWNYPNHAGVRVELEAGAARFTPGLKVYDGEVIYDRIAAERDAPIITESELRALDGDR